MNAKHDQYDRLMQRYANVNAKTLYGYDSRGNLMRKARNINGETRDTTD
jgi:hypothetical protein